MSVSRWRRGLAAVVDVCVGVVPPLSITAWWLAAIAGTATEGLGILLYFGAPALVFTAPSLLWPVWIWGAHRGHSRRRSVGLVLSGMAYTDDRVLVRSERSGPVELLTQIGAATLTVAHALALSFVAYNVGGIGWAILTG